MANKNDKRLAVLVCQNGARRRYAIPRMLEQEGVLVALYTDSTVHSLFGRFSVLCMKFGITIPKFKALVSRDPQGVPRNKIFSTDRASFAAFTKGLFNADTSPSLIKWGLQNATVIYSMYGENYGFLTWAKKRGAKIIVDVFVHPATNRIVAQERKNFLGDQPDTDQMDAEDRHSKAIFKMADLLICPSQWVADGVRQFMPECADKVRHSPYGNSLKLKDAVNSPERGRILFAGREALRKGLHYLAEAAHILRAKGHEIELRAAGVEADSIEWMEHKGEVNCLGHIPLDKMQEEYCRADIFILPSLSEGQAGVVLEALACGCPVIATRESGVDFEQDAGVIVSSRNAEAIADAVEKILTDRVFRNTLSAGARNQSGMFTMEAYQHRLIDVINTLA